MNYWDKRIQEQNDILAQKTEKEIRKAIIEAYRQARNETIWSYLNLYSEIVAEVGKDALKANDVYRFNNYYLLINETQKRLKNLGDMQTKVINEKLKDLYNEVYDTMPLETTSTFGVIGKTKAEDVVNAIWCADGKHWSKRIWESQAELQLALQKGLTTCMIKGDSPSKLKKALMEQFNVSYRAADRIVRTETAHIETVSAQNRYKDAGVKRVKILVEANACDECKAMKNQEYDIELAQTLVPKHPNCRCCIIPVIDA